MKGKLIFNGVSSEELGIVVQTPPTYQFPERDVETTHVPGRNGDLVVDNKCFKNVARTYSLAKGFTILKHYSANSEAVLAWLTSCEGKYVRLEDTYDPEVYRMAMYNQSGSFTDFYDKALAIEVQFECKPQRFLKDGDIPIVYTVGNLVTIENPSHYPSLPLIKITGIEQSISNILMMSVIDNDGNIVSNLTFSDIPNGIAYIDSELQNCYDGNSDINEDINLNGGNFPVLNDGKSTVAIKLYEKQNGTIDSYNNVISDKQDLCKSQYKPYSVLEESNQNKFYVKAYISLIDNNKNTYEASAYQTYVTAKCKEQSDVSVADAYTFKSYNTLLSSYCNQYSFSGDIAGLEFPEWMIAIQNGDSITVSAGVDGFFISSSDKTVRFLRSGDEICTAKKTGTITITYYEKDDTTGKPVIKYDDLPSWLDFDLILSTSDDGTVTFSKIQYKTKLAGYVWTDKTSIFGKASWNYYPAGTVLSTLSWSTIKKAFMPTTGISTSTTSSFTYYWISSVIQYISDDTAIDFTVEFTDQTLTNIKIKAAKEGYYSGKNGSTELIWAYYSIGDQIMLVKGTDSFDVNYLESIPDYSKEEGFPDWLNPVPVFTPSNIPMNAKTLTFKVNKTSKYRYSTGDNTYSDWKDVSAESNIAMSKTLEDSFYICQIDSIPTEYDHDRAYNDSATVPDYLDVSYYTDEDSGDEKVKYCAKLEGYYKWDSNASWIKKDVGDLLLSTDYKDDTTFYHLTVLPAYIDYPFEDYIKITPIEDTGGNPTEVIITAKVGGYFRINSNSDWTWYSAGSTLFTATVGEQTKIYYLGESATQPTSIQITITPRWWML